ncbi:hypothetical protein N7447_005908 [Penicillium robsamsonii]|uniref:uncharacterized protein n=1 Tax=Penicillium robsamsonii TaxID=1792511 RepID=UPI002548A9F2|nr:uncharacterized protein N7447_005908 [Penicillium robsamsonii]KAJ5823568.1 hypothetical protein N7447_005908 [Penicillium robsamsonii]
MPIPLRETPNEADLERSGNINALQYERWRLWEIEKPNVNADFNIYNLLQTEVNLRENIQREMALEHKLAACQKEHATNPNLNLVTRIREVVVGQGFISGRPVNPRNRIMAITPKVVYASKFEAGHCTIECLCCEKSRGFAFTAKGKEIFDMEFDLAFDKGYFRRIRHASLLGLIHDNDDNPFDLIDDHPRSREAPSA